MPANPESILDSVKQAIGVSTDLDVFDLDIIMHINTSFGVLQQLAAGPLEGFTISDNTALWSDFSPDMVRLSPVKSYVFTTVKLLFDPPATSFAIDSVQKLRAEFEWRTNVIAEDINPPTEPFPTPPEEEVIFEGGIMPTFFAPKTVTLGYTPTVTPDASEANVFYLTIYGPCLIEAPVSGVQGQHITMELTSNGYPVTWGSGWNFGGTGTPVLTPAGTDIISAVFYALFAEWHAGYTPGF